MSATPTQIDWSSDHAAPLKEGNRVLESIGRKDSVGALLAFSGLHDQIRSHRSIAGTNSDQDLFQTERFVRDEVLQLICDRTQSLTASDSVIIAVAEGSDFVCRASAGPMPVPRGIRLNRQSAFLQSSLQSGKIFRCDDSEIDVRVEHDFIRELGARATVLVPLRGRKECLGVLQAFSATPWAFTDQDVRCFDLFAELVLAALKPEDQDRRFHWLSDVAAAVLQAKPAIEKSTDLPTVAATEQPRPQPAKVEVAKSADAPPTQPPLDLPTIPSPPAAAQTSIPESAGLKSTTPEPAKAIFEQTQPEAINPEPQPTPPPPAPLWTWFPEPESSLPADAKTHEVVGLEALSQPIELPFPTDDSADTGASEREERAIPAPREPFFAFVRNISWPGSSSPGLTVVLGLTAVAALFSAGVWWGMQVHGRPVSTKVAYVPRAVTTPAAPAVAAPTIPDLPAPKSASTADDAPLVPVSEDKLATLPKVTGIRHWSSSMGSTVVIDMEDQVNYEVHRLMSPERIYFDLHDTALASDLDGKAVDIGDVSLTRIRVAQPVSGVTRIVLDTRDGSNFSVSMETNPYRLVVELRDSTKMAVVTRPVPKLASKPSEQFSAKASVTPAHTGKFRIVLDPGHGGWDLGTVGRQGLLEKDLVLDVTKRLGKLLQSRLGADVQFTRSADDYLPLDERADFANQAQADLFVSVHANYSSSANARGVETYYTNLFSAPGTKEIEKHPDGTFAQPMPVSLSPAGLQEKIEESRRLAASVQHALYATLAAKSPDIRDRGIKDASFVVLTGTTMPSILTEISFVSSPADEHNLQSEAYRQQIAEALYKGIARYEDSAPRAKVAQLRPAAASR
jgi:N-acetylmuramoyl-L-alanine amidase